jgi:hypothetical protein
MVFSRNPHNHPGFWRKLDPENPAQIPVGARTWLAIGPGPKEKGEPVWGDALPRLLQQLQKRRLECLICGPLGSGEPGIDAFARFTTGMPVLRLPALFGPHDPFFWTAIRQLERGESPLLPPGLPLLKPLFVEDAAKAAIARLTGTLYGPEEVDSKEFLNLLAGRYQRSYKMARMFWPPPWVERAKAQGSPQRQPDCWEESLGTKTTLLKWLERLPKSSPGG